MPEITEERLTEIIQCACDKAFANSESRMLKMFGLPDDEEGRKVLLDMGGSFRTMVDIKKEMRTQGIRSGVKNFFSLLKFLAIGAALGMGYKLGLLDRILK